MTNESQKLGKDCGRFHTFRDEHGKQWVYDYEHPQNVYLENPGSPVRDFHLIDGSILTLRGAEPSEEGALAKAKEGLSAAILRKQQANWPPKREITVAQQHMLDALMRGGY